VGDQADSRSFDTATVHGRIVELIAGEHPHTRSGNNVYARDPISGVIHEFDGHRRLINIHIESDNYLKTSYLSGDQIRKTVTGTIMCDGEQVYEFSHRDPQAALLQAYRLLGLLQEHESDWLSADSRLRMIGRPIYFHEMPATVVRTIEDQGCIMIHIAAKDAVVVVRGQQIEELWEDWRGADGSYTIKDDVLSPHIWWWRDEPEQEEKTQ
jgi:hypothetical protein